MDSKDEKGKKKKCDEKGLKIPKGPKPRLFIQNALDMAPAPQWMVTLPKKYGSVFRIVSPIVGKLIFCSDPTYVETIMTQPTLWAKLHMKLIPVRKQVGPGLFTANDDEEIWGQAHRILIPAFSLFGMKKYFSIIQHYINVLLNKWEEIAKNGEVFDPNHWLAKFTFDVIGQVALGMELKAITSTELHPFLHIFERLMEVRDGLRAHPLRNTFIKPTALMKEGDDLTNQLKQFINKVIQEKRKALSELKEGDTKSIDLITLMLETTDPKTGQKLPDENVISQIFTFLVAGHDSTSTALTTLLYNIAQDAKVENLVLKEATQLLGTEGGELTWEAIGKADYSMQVIKENLRLWAPAISIIKTATEETKLGPYRIKKGQMVLVSIHGMHHNPTVYNDPEKFDPSRFTAEEIAKRNNYAWMPFSSGPRACIGMQLSLIEQKSLLLNAVHKFSFRLDSSSHVSFSNPLFLKPHGIKLKIYARENSQVPRPLSPTGDKKSISELFPTLDSSQKSAGGKLVILFGSNTGTSQEFANQIAAQGQAFGFETFVNPLDHVLDSKFVVPSGPKQVLIIVTSTYNGLPPDNAEKFSKLITAESEAKKAISLFKDVNYTVFGCGNSQWKTYQVFPGLVDKALEKFGAKRFSDVGRGDADSTLEDDFLSWKNHMWVDLFHTLGLEFNESHSSSLEHEFPLFEITEAKEGVQEEKEELKDFVAQTGGKFSVILVNKELQSEGSDRSTRHIEVKRPASIPSYSAGDHLGVLPNNNPDLIKEAADILKVKLETVVIIKPKSGTGSLTLPYNTPITIETILKWGLELQANATRSQISFLASKTECPPEKKRLESLANPNEDIYTDYIINNKRTVLELLKEFKSIDLPFREFVSIMPMLKPRFYSISSSSLLYPDSIHITVGVIKGESVTGRKFYGACSDYLSRLKSGDFVRIFVKDTKSSFRLPTNPSTPVIMIGPGTGLAPMRGFIQERKAQEAKNKGSNILFFGCRNDSDYLYKEELENYAKEGHLTLEVAFSRKESSKVYVQHKLATKEELVWKQLQEGAHVYICGDAKHMAKDVKKTFIEILKKYAHHTEQAAEEYINNLTNQRRYCQDVWASTN